MQKYNIRNCIYLGKVFHARLKPKKHRFNYKVFYLNINLEDIKEKKLPFFLSYNRLNIFSFYDKDHGPLNCNNIDAWIRNLIPASLRNQHAAPKACIPKKAPQARFLM